MIKPTVLSLALILILSLCACSPENREQSTIESEATLSEPAEKAVPESVSGGSEASEESIPEVLLEKMEFTPDEAKELLKDDGSGVVIIDSPKRLFALAALVNSGDESYRGKTYSLQKDINMSEYDFTPIGGLNGEYEGYEFNAVLDGGDHLIKNLTIRNTGFEEGTGLFGVIGPEGRVENLHVTNGNVNGKIATGGFAGRSSGIMRNCSYQGVVHSESGNVGGLVGAVSFAGAPSDISACFVNARVSGNQNTGTFAGDIAFGAAISDCYALGSVAAVKGEGGAEASAVGGFIGRNSNAQISRCYSNTEVYTNVASALVGGFAGSSEGKQESCYYNYTATANWKPIGSAKAEPEDESGSGQEDELPIVDGVRACEALTLCEQGTYEGWDFHSIWNISDTQNRGLPFLR